jgi:hypothetical protein
MSITAILGLISALGSTIQSITAAMNQIVGVVQKAQAEGRELNAEEVELIKGIRISSENELQAEIDKALT